MRDQCPAGGEGKLQRVESRPGTNPQARGASPLVRVEVDRPPLLVLIPEVAEEDLQLLLRVYGAPEPLKPRKSFSNSAAQGAGPELGT